MLYSSPQQLCFPPVAGHTLRADFEGGALSSDFGALCSAITPSTSLWTLTRAAGIIVRDPNLATEKPLGNDTMHALAPQWVASR
jgi:hypothetical protein